MHKQLLKTLVLAAIGALPATAHAQILGAGGNQSHVVCPNGSVWSWGNNFFGQMAGGTGPSSNVPLQLTSLPNVAAFDGGHRYTLALKQDGTVWAFGDNSDGQLGLGNFVVARTPTQVTALTGASNVSAGYAHSLATKSDGTLWAWGRGSNGRLGLGNSSAGRTSPTQIVGMTGMTAVAAGFDHSLALKNNGTVWAFGYGFFGQMGNGSAASVSVPEQVSGLTGATAIAAGYQFSVALKNDGTVWTWGRNDQGALGNGTLVNSSVPVQVNNLTNVVAISANGGDNVLALKSDGTVWAWGGNNNGQLGNGTFNNSNVPVLVSGLTGVAAIEMGGNHALARKTDGTVWVWGANNDGQLGLGNSLNRLSPVLLTGMCSGTSATTARAAKNANAAYPNPTTGAFVLRLGEARSVSRHISIYNALGRCVLTLPATAAQVPIDLSAQAKGLYFYQVTEAHGARTTGSVVVH